MRAAGRRRLAVIFRFAALLRRRVTRFGATAFAALLRRRTRRFAGAFFTARRAVVRFAALDLRRDAAGFLAVRFFAFVADLRDAFLLAAILYLLGLSNNRAVTDRQYARSL
ncbi:MAG TPA: hypothetical protein VF274_02490 [Alphaproteobacteria bacterium]